MRWFEGWGSVGETVLAGVLAYAFLVVLLRASGKRTLSKLNAFDFVVTVAIGSTLSSILVSKNLALADGLAALGTLVGLQWLVAWLSVRSRVARKAVRNVPRLLLHRGEILDEVLESERMVRDEVLAAVRAAGAADLSDVGAVVLETDGSISVIRDVGASAERTAMRDVAQ